MKRIAAAAASVVAGLPGSTWLLRKAALAPAARKTQVFERAMAALGRRSVLGQAAPAALATELAGTSFRVIEAARDPHLK